MLAVRGPYFGQGLLLRNDPEAVRCSTFEVEPRLVILRHQAEPRGFRGRLCASANA